MKQSALLSDFYALTMAQGYWLRDYRQEAVFEMFFRRQPFGGGFSVFAGLETLLEKIRATGFYPEDIAYLDNLGIFDKRFLDYLSAFKFTGKIWSMDEGTVIFPQEPIIRVQGTLIECQIIESLLLNTVNFQSLIATKAARVWLASGKGRVMEFGLRRAQGPDGALSASRAAFIGGAESTSNVLAGKTFGIPVMGTMAHSWVMSYPGEEEAFQAYADIYPNHPVFLIDTYDTLRSGIQNAAAVGRRLAAQGRTFGVRLDSGDIHYLSMEVRKFLDAQGLTDATITVSNDLDESIIQTLTNAGAPINTWGVGTQLVTGGSDAAFTGVYKLAAKQDAGGSFQPVMKFSDHPEKTTNPGIKQVWRLVDANGNAVADILSLDDPADPGDAVVPGNRYAFWHPSADYRHFYHDVTAAEPMLKLRMDRGELLCSETPLAEIQKKVKAGLEIFDSSYKRMLNPHIYKVSVTARLRDLKLDLIKNHLGDL
ncbi:nicotinate phosphoribosyltransferase [Breznakiella homolactica]|uniref:Nicotinate phosphoribosyltransferase n=1 Tax=Breznakiella homolactica TaxID=2798577 RepID=A0A7T7XJB0_9SPIR|nr:nicotinate phosphoribosyltransferase [Breznakiella homolactica]QQO07421.1 nicotinate phosphoribosyltransferase [Breznakiella homolactica]